MVRLAGAAALTDFRFTANVSLTTIVGRLNCGVFYEHEQGCKVIDQFILQPNERRLGIGHDILNDDFANDDFAVAGAQSLVCDVIVRHADAGEKITEYLLSFGFSASDARAE